MVSAASSPWYGSIWKPGQQGGAVLSDLGASQRQRHATVATRLHPGDRRWQEGLRTTFAILNDLCRSSSIRGERGEAARHSLDDLRSGTRPPLTCARCPIGCIQTSLVGAHRISAALPQYAEPRNAKYNIHRLERAQP